MPIDQAGVALPQATVGELAECSICLLSTLDQGASQDLIFLHGTI